VSRRPRRPLPASGPRTVEPQQPRLLPPSTSGDMEVRDILALTVGAFGFVLPGVECVAGLAPPGDDLTVTAASGPAGDRLLGQSFPDHGGTLHLGPVVAHMVGGPVLELRVALAFLRPDGGTFTRKQRRVAADFAHVVAVAVHQAVHLGGTSWAGGQLRLATEAALELTSSPEPDEVLHCLVERASRATDADAGDVWEVLPDGLRHAASWDRERGRVPAASVPRCERLVAHALRERRPVAGAAAAPWRHLVAGPLYAGEQPTAVLLLARRSDRPFSAAEGSLVDVLSDIGGLALRNARLLAADDAARHRADDGVLRMLLAMEMARDLAAALPARDAAARVLRQAAATIGADRATLYRVEGDEEVVATSWDRDGEPRPVGERHPLRQGAHVARAMRTGEPVRVRPRADLPPALRHGALIPLIVAGEEPSFIALARRRDTPFTAGDKAMMRLVAALGGLALRNARLFARVEDARDAASAAMGTLAIRNRRQAALADLHRAALAAGTAAQVLEAAARTVARTLDVEVVRVMEAGTGGSPALVAGHGRLDDGVAALSEIAVEVPGEDRPVGELRVLSGRPEAFGEEAIAFLQAVAQAVAVALRRCRGEAALARSLELLRSTDDARLTLMASLARTAEDERETIARDIHDDALQAMAATMLRLQLLAEGAEDEAWRSGVPGVLATLDATVGRLRGLIVDLRADALDHGLGAALRLYTAQLAAGRETAYEVVDRLSAQPEPGMRLIAYRVVQEALVNARRHAHAARVEVVLESAGGELHVTVRDDGRGFASGDLDRSLSPGLAAMRERAESAGGRLTIESAPGAGTRVDLRVPIAAL
jgi:signal transduction histidine kinase